MPAASGHPVFSAAHTGIENQKTFLDSRLPDCVVIENRQMLLFCHSGLDPESSAVSDSWVSGCRIKSGMTVAN